MKLSAVGVVETRRRGRGSEDRIRVSGESGGCWRKHSDGGQSLNGVKWREGREEEELERRVKERAALG